MIASSTSATEGQNVHDDGVCNGMIPTIESALCVPKIRFCSIDDEGRQGQAVM
jgi:hypothetical protein